MGHGRKVQKVREHFVKAEKRVGGGKTVTAVPTVHGQKYYVAQVERMCQVRATRGRRRKAWRAARLWRGGSAVVVASDDGSAAAALVCEV